MRNLELHFFLASTFCVPLQQKYRLTSSELICCTAQVFTNFIAFQRVVLIKNRNV